MPAIQFTTIEDALHAWVVAGSGLASASVQWGMQNQPRPAGPWISLQVIGIDPVGDDWTDNETNPLVVATQTLGAVDTGLDRIVATAHPYVTGDGPFDYDTTITPIGGLTDGQDVWIIVVDANTIKLARKFTDAINGIAINLTSAGSGVHTLVTNASTVRAGSELKRITRGWRVATISVQCFGGAAFGDTSGHSILSTLAASANDDGHTETLRTARVGIGDIGAIRALGGVLNFAKMEPRASMEIRAHIKSELTAIRTFIERCAIENLGTGSTFTVDAAEPAP